MLIEPPQAFYQRIEMIRHQYTSTRLVNYIVSSAGVSRQNWQCRRQSFANDQRTALKIDGKHKYLSGVVIPAQLLTRYWTGP